MMPNEDEGWDKKDATEESRMEELKKEIQRLKVLISPSQDAVDGAESTPKGRGKTSLSDEEIIDAINKAKLLVSEEELEESRAKLRDLVLKRMKKPKKS